MVPLLIFATLSAASPGAADYALALCRPKLAARVSGDISSVEINRSSVHGRSTVIRGAMRALTGMGAPEPGMASTHHLRRQDFLFTCWVKSGRVRKIRLDAIN